MFDVHQVPLLSHACELSDVYYYHLRRHQSSGSRCISILCRTVIVSVKRVSGWGEVRTVERIGMDRSDRDRVCTEKNIASRYQVGDVRKTAGGRVTRMSERQRTPWEEQPIVRPIIQHRTTKKIWETMECGGKDRTDECECSARYMKVR